MIRAEVHSDDFLYAAKFDATEFFEEASDLDILELEDCGWGGDYPADEVARSFDIVEFPDVQNVFDYCARKDAMGFECHIHEADAIKWLIANRPSLARQISEIREISFQELIDESSVDTTPSWDLEPSTWSGEYNQKNMRRVF